MLKNYLTLAWRILNRNKLHALINIAGLAIGISACLVIFLIVRYEFSFDNFHKDGSRIYRVYSTFSGDFKAVNRGVPAAMAGAVKSELTGLESVAGFHIWSAGVYIIDSTNQRKDFGNKSQIVLAGPEYFDVFDSYIWLAGNPVASLTRPNQVVLTESRAKAYFGVADARLAVGKEIHYRDSLIVSVSGIVKDFAAHSDLGFENFISLATIQNSWLKRNIRLDDWGSTNSGSQLFLKLNTGKSAADMEAGLVKLSGIYKENHKDNNWYATYHLQPLSDLHFNPEIGTFDNGGNGASLPTLKLLIIVAILLLVIAAINFINLETAQAVRRAKEVGIRKVMGSTRGKLIVHFLLQSTLLTCFAVVLAIPFSELAIHFFTEFIPPAVHLDLTDEFTLAFIGISILVVSFLAGLYPAFSLSSFLPALALKNQVSANSNRTRTAFVRKGLIVFQFTFAQAMIIATLIVGWQIRYMLEKDLGFSKEGILYFETSWKEPHEKCVTLKNELEKLPEVMAVSLCADAPASTGYNSSTWKYNNGKEELHHNVYRKYGDTAFISVFDLKLIAGRNIHRSDSADEYVINETYSKLLGFKNPKDAIDQLLISDNKRYPIVGVVKDFNFRPLQIAVEPAIIADEEYNFGTIAIKFNTARGGKSIESLTTNLDKLYKKVYPDQKLEYAFLDEAIAKFYEHEQRTSKLINTATGIAVLISCLGLFGLATFTTMQRTKEIGIRKVLGATVNNIVLLLSREFVLLVLLAFVIAAPASWYFANDWLAKFAYRTTVGWEIYLWTIVSAVLIVALSVSYQAFKSAIADPVKSLRYE